MSSDDAVLNLEILAGGPYAPKHLLEDYDAGGPALRPFYFGNPRSAEAFRRKAGEVAARFDGDGRRAMARAIRPTSQRAAERLRSVVEEGGFFITTGQQAGLFSGPLYTLYKILSAVAFAPVLERTLGVPVAPLFWIGSEDHDWAEVNHAHVLDVANRLQRIEVRQDGDTPLHSMARRRLGPGIEDALDQLSQLLPDTDFAPALLKQIRGAYRPDRTMAEAFETLVSSWLGRFDLLITDAADPHVKRLSAPLLADDLRRSVEAEAAVARQTERLEEAGYRGQVPVIAEATNVLYEDGLGRGRIQRTASGFHAHDGAVRWSAAELDAAIRKEPTSFSPNVLLRPLVESRVFPTLCYLAGPSEVAYFAQLGCLFRMHGMAAPLVVPRRGAMLVEPKVRKVLDKFDLDVTDLEPPLHEIASRLARDELPEDVTDRLGTLRRALQEGYDRLGEAARAIDPTLKGPLNSARAASFKELGHFEKKVLRQLKDKNEISLRQLEKARANLFPESAPQERVLSPVHYLARYGDRLLDALVARFAMDAPGTEPDWEGDGCA